MNMLFVIFGSFSGLLQPPQLELEADVHVKIKLWKSSFQPNKGFMNRTSMEEVMAILVACVNAYCKLKKRLF